MSIPRPAPRRTWQPSWPATRPPRATTTSGAPSPSCREDVARPFQAEIGQTRWAACGRPLVLFLLGRRRGHFSNGVFNTVPKRTLGTRASGRGGHAAKQAPHRPGIVRADGLRARVSFFVPGRFSLDGQNLGFHCSLPPAQTGTEDSGRLYARGALMVVAIVAVLFGLLLPALQRSAKRPTVSGA
jgi:hypothetical protein